MNLLNVAAFLSLSPELVATSAEINGPTGFDGFIVSLFIHVSKHKNIPGRNILSNNRKKIVAFLEIWT